MHTSYIFYIYKIHITSLYIVTLVSLKLFIVNWYAHHWTACELKDQNSPVYSLLVLNLFIMVFILLLLHYNICWCARVKSNISPFKRLITCVVKLIIIKVNVFCIYEHKQCVKGSKIISKVRETQWITLEWGIKIHI